MLSSLRTGDNGGANGGAFGRKTGLGVEVGYMVQENLWLSAGYNVWGIKDKDLTANEYTDRGAYVRLRYKFDETAAWLGQNANTGGISQTSSASSQYPNRKADASLSELNAVEFQGRGEKLGAPPAEFAIDKADAIRVRKDLWHDLLQWQRIATEGAPAAAMAAACGKTAVNNGLNQLAWAGWADTTYGWRTAMPYIAAAERAHEVARKSIHACALSAALPALETKQ